MIERLQKHEDLSHAVEWNIFEGVKDRKPYGDFIEGGVYYGQMKSGKRDGSGFLYCFTIKKQSILYEGKWKLGTPIKAQCTYIIGNERYKYDGRLDDKYLFTGIGNWCAEGGDNYVGSLEKGDFHGYGEYTYKDGDKFEGQWRHDKKHGLGKYICSDGSYEIGEYKDGKENGEHTEYSKEGIALEILIYYDGNEIGTRKVN
ncbi:hypothetical protein FGO68_gene6318 [Halteria grandinella]|uniref:MORN repeat-containing protein n=1 Tax=Halteria grandinella TaxID=5974 RepID=A0A8J8SWB4_HALGN|nr:hypothetical protein FGO68_gene6318 [Halteria grandinella]